MLDTSALFPTATNEEIPRPISRAASMIAAPTTPDWLIRPTRPRSGTTGTNVAWSDTAGSVLMIPNALGPMRRIP